MNRMNLSWGGGQMSAVLSLRWKSILAYGSIKTQKDMHTLFPGGYAHHSPSGRHGGGWIPAGLTIRPVGTYRVDSAYTECMPWAEVPETLPGIKIQAPVDCRAGEISTEWPIIVSMYNGSTICLVDSKDSSLMEVISGELIGYHFGNLEVSCFKSPDSGLGIEKIEYMSKDGKLPRNGKRALMALNIKDLKFSYGEREENYSDFFRSLGLRELSDGYLYKVTQRVCSARYTRAELNSVAALQVVSPENVMVLKPWLYVQESGTVVTANAEIGVEDQIVEVRVSLSNHEFISALSGNTDSLEQKLEEEARVLYRPRRISEVDDDEEQPIRSGIRQQMEDDSLLEGVVYVIE